MTLIPDLERQLTEAAGTRVRAPRRLAGLTAAAVVAAVLVAGLAAVLLAGERDGEPAASGVLGLDVPEGRQPTLADLFAVFAREPTPRDDNGWTKDELDEIPDRQPGEDPTRSRRVGPPDDPVFIWPMRDGVCSSFGNCLGLDTLVDVGGVAIGTSSGYERGGRPVRLEVHGIAVDGIDEIRLTRPGAEDVVVPVERNAFHVDALRIRPIPTGARWTDAGGAEHRFRPRALFPTGPPPPR